MYRVCMDIRKAAARVATNVRTAATAHPLTTVAQAADMQEVDLNARLQGDEDFTVNDLLRVGGFLRVRPAAFMEGVTA